MLKPGWGGQARGLFDWARFWVNSGDVVWDIGANQGLFSIAAAAQGAKKIIAFEPDLDMCRLISRSKRACSFHQLNLLPIAVGGHNCISEFVIAQTDRALNHLAESAGNQQLGGAKEINLVPTMTIDDLVKNLPQPHVVKIDVEGAELAVIQNANHLLRETRPLFIFECEAQNISTISDIFRRFNYQFFSPDSKVKKSLKCLGWNTLVVPDEKIISTFGKKT